MMCFFSSRRRHTRWPRDWSSDVCSSDLAPLLPDAHADHDGRAGEAEVLPQATLDEAPIPVLEEPAGEDHEPWWPGTGLGREQDPRLLAATERMRVRGHQGAEEGVQATGGEDRKSVV